MTAISVPYRLVDAAGSCRSVLASVTVDASGRMSAPVSWLDGVTASTSPPSIPTGGTLEPGQCCIAPAAAFGVVGAPGVVAERALSGSMSSGFASYSSTATTAIVNASTTQPMLVLLHGRVLAEDAGAASLMATWRAHGEFDPGTGVFAEVGVCDNALRAVSRLAVPWVRTLTVPAGTTVTVGVRARPNLLGARDFVADPNARAAITLDAWVGIYA